MLKRYWWAWLALVNVAAFGAMAVARHASAPDPDVDVPLAYGSVVGSDVVALLEREDSRQWANAFLYFPGKTPPNSTAGYLKVLAAKHSPAGLGVFVVLPPGSPSQSSELEIVDRGGATVHRALNAPWDHDHPTFAIVSRSGVVQFHNFGLPREDILRQLSERFSAGTVAYDAGPEQLPQLFQDGLGVPELRLVGASDGQPIRLTPDLARDATILLLGAPCAPCQLSAFSRLVSELGRDSSPTANLLVIAAPHFDGKQVSGAFGGVPKAKVFVLAADTPGYDLYATRSNDPDLRPWVLRTDSQGQVRSRERLAGS